MRYMGYFASLLHPLVEKMKSISDQGHVLLPKFCVVNFL